MKRTLLSHATLGALLLVLGACSSMDSSTQPELSVTPAGGDGDGGKGKQEPKDIAELEQGVSMAKTRLDVARMELKAFERKQVNEIGHAEAEVELAKAKLANFRTVEGPNSLARQKLDFQGAQENAAEAAEELAQIMIMYEEQDLNDMTREYVVARGKRRAERAEARIAIQAASLKAFETHELPSQRRRIELELEKAQQALEQAKLEGEIARINKTLSIQEAESKLKSAQKELDGARAEKS